MTLVLKPISRADANAYVRAHHRHHQPVVADLFRVAALRDGQLVGVAMTGRPMARMLCDGTTAEVVRVCTDGSPNVCSFLLGASWRAAKALGYTRLFTYTLATEPGVSLRAAGWKVDGTVDGHSWSRPSRPRDDKHPTIDKIRWRAH